MTCDALGSSESEDESESLDPFLTGVGAAFVGAALAGYECVRSGRAKIRGNTLTRTPLRFTWGTEEFFETIGASLSESDSEPESESLESLESSLLGEAVDLRVYGM